MCACWVLVFVLVFCGGFGFVYLFVGLVLVWVLGFGLIACLFVCFSLNPSLPKVFSVRLSRALTLKIC